jgi:hypothetical protein
MKQLLTSIFGANDTASNTLESVAKSDESVSADQKPFKEWTLSFIYKQDDNNLHRFTMSTTSALTEADSNANRERFKGIITKFYEHLLTVDEDGYVNFDNSVIIKKSQFVSLLLVNG